jgi:hypothetical protein
MPMTKDIGGYGRYLRIFKACKLWQSIVEHHE